MPEESISPHALKILAEIATAVEKTDASSCPFSAITRNPVPTDSDHLCENTRLSCSAESRSRGVMTRRGKTRAANSPMLLQPGAILWYFLV